MDLYHFWSGVYVGPKRRQILIYSSNPLLQQKESELNRILTKTRHYNITCVIAVQTVKFIIKNLKRMLSDAVIWKGVSEEDFKNFMKETSHSFNSDIIWNQYHQLQDQHSRLELHFVANTYKFVLEGTDLT